MIRECLRRTLLDYAKQRQKKKLQKQANKELFDKAYNHAMQEEGAKMATEYAKEQAIKDTRAHFEKKNSNALAKVLDQLPTSQQLQANMDRALFGEKK